MSKFNSFTEVFDTAINNKDVETASSALESYVREHSEHTQKALSESFKITRSWMNYDGGDNREASTRNTDGGQEAIKKAQVKLGI